MAQVRLQINQILDPVKSCGAAVNVGLTSSRSWIRLSSIQRRSMLRPRSTTMTPDDPTEFAEDDDEL